MAEFCLECLKKINGIDELASKYIISEDFDLCEECGEWKTVIVAERSRWLIRLYCRFRLAVLTKIREKLRKS